VASGAAASAARRKLWNRPPSPAETAEAPCFDIDVSGKVATADSI
jgi:hypothetical protein